MYKRGYLSVLFFLFLFSFDQATMQAADLKFSRDSLAILLRQTPQTDGARRLELLNHLCDIDLILGDTTHIYPCWLAAVNQRNVNSMDDLAVPLAMRALKSGQQDSLNIWIERCKENFSGGLLECNLEYLQLMKDIRDYKNFKQLSERLLKEQIRIDPVKEPYRAMRILYTLGIICSFEKSGNPKLTLKSSEEYMKEALDIARRLPFREGSHFHRQILLGISSNHIDYARQYLAFVHRFLTEPDIKERPFYSRRALISAYEKLIVQGTEMPRKELDSYYQTVCRLMKDYPNDAPLPLDYFEARVSFRYNKAIGNVEESLRWCDSLIHTGPKYDLDPIYYYGEKFVILGKQRRWEEGYHFAELYMQVKDSLQNVSSEEKLSELQTQYDVDILQTKEKERRNQLIWVSIIGVLLAVFFIFYIIYSRHILAKNRAMLEQLRQYVLLVKKEKELAISTARQETDLIGTDETSTEAKEENKMPLQPSELFLRLEKIVQNEKLYLAPDLNRDMLVERLGTNKNKLAEAILSGTGCNLMEYITELRLRETLLLMESSPKLSLTIIAEQSGFNAYSSFYRAFYKRYGVKPVQYRNYISH